MSFRNTLLGLLLVWTSVACAQPRDTGALAADLQTTLNEFRDRYELPGATAAIATRDGRLVAAASGLADVEANRHMTTDTPMLAASIGKTFVAAIILNLETQGHLSQDDLIEAYLGDRTWFDRLPNAHSITIGHLLRHQSGLPDHVQLPEFQGEFVARVKDGGVAFTPEELIAFVCDEKPLFEPGTGWSYSDSGYILLGLIIEQVTGRSYYDELEATLLAPLGLHTTVPSNTRFVPDLAVGYTGPDNSFGLPARTVDQEGRLVWDPSSEWTGGGLASTSGDLARWGQLLFSDQALPVSYLDRLIDAAPVSPETPGILYGTGVAIYADSPHGPIYGHGGWIPGYVSSLRHYPDYAASVAFQINTDVGVEDEASDLVPALEAALSDLVNKHVSRSD